MTSPSGHPAASSADALRRMKRQSQRNTAIERHLRSALHRQGLRFRLHQCLLPETRREADIVFSSTRVAVFVDGCFWHGCPVHGTLPRANREFWRAKLARNRDRDRETEDLLAKRGWLVVRVWEHDDTAAAAERIREAVESRRVDVPPE